MKKKIVASIEARMGSSRLPGKVMMKIAGVPSLVHTIRRVKRASQVSEVVLATTMLEEDDILADVAKHEGISCFRGSDTDVLGRVCGAHEMMNSDIIVEVTGDCPLIDPEILDLGISKYQSSNFDVVSNTWLPGFPQGMDVQVFKRSLLEEVRASIFDPDVREHVSLYFYKNQEKYKIFHLIPKEKWKAPDIRAQIDYKEDYIFLCQVVEALVAKYGEKYGINEFLSLLDENPNLKSINSGCVEKSLK